MEYIGHSPKYTKDGLIILFVKFPWLDAEVPFCASPTDIEPHGVEIYNLCLAGKFGSIEPYINNTTQVQIIPQTISAFQAKAALSRQNLLSQVEALMFSGNVPEEARLAWEYARDFNRDSPTINGLAKMLSLTDEQIDNLFILGATIVA